MCITLADETAVSICRAKVASNLGILHCTILIYSSITYRRLKVFVTFKILIGIFLVLTSCFQTCSYQFFWEVFCLHIQVKVHPEDRDRKFKLTNARHLVTSKYVSVKKYKMEHNYIHKQWQREITLLFWQWNHSSYRSSHKRSLCLKSELDYFGTNGIETSYPIWSMSWSLRFGTLTDNTFKVKKIPWAATRKEEGHALLLTAKLRLVQNPFKNVLPIYQFKKK
jgi:hypothetical protein